MLRRALASIAIVLLVLSSTSAIATAQRTFVASYGNDANPCSLTLPCRSFEFAVFWVKSGGEVIVLDSAGYGLVTITKPVSIIAPPGVYAGVSGSDAVGIAVDSGTGTVVLAGLTINGFGVGIDFQSGDTLRVERTTVSGALVGLRSSVPATGALIIYNSGFYSNAEGLLLDALNGQLTIEIDQSHFDQNTFGISVFDNVFGVISRSSISKTASFALRVTPGSLGSTSAITVRNCILSANSYGIDVGTISGMPTTVQLTDVEVSDTFNTAIAAALGATVTLSNTTVTRNGIGLFSSGGVLKSLQDNLLFGNATDGSFTSTISKQ